MGLFFVFFSCCVLYTVGANGLHDSTINRVKNNAVSLFYPMRSGGFLFSFPRDMDVTAKIPVVTDVPCYGKCYGTCYVTPLSD